MAGFQSYKRCKGYKFISASKGSQRLGKQRFQIITKENTCGPQEYGGSFFFYFKNYPYCRSRSRRRSRSKNRISTLPFANGLTNVTTPLRGEGRGVKQQNNLNGPLKGLPWNGHLYTYKQACCAGCRRRPFPMQLHQ